MATRYFALIFGILYTLVGVMGLIPGLLRPLSQGNPPVTFEVLSGDLLGLFPVNILHTLVHLGIGIWGIMAYRSFTAARSFAIMTGIAFLGLFLFGLIPGLQTLFGLLPLHGADRWLHLFSGVAALSFGITAPRGGEVTDHV